MRLTHVLLPLAAAAAFFFAATTTPAQNPAQDANQERINPNVDPKALDALKATADTLKNAKTFTFRATVQREAVGANGEIVTTVRQHDVAIARPDRARLHVTGDGQTVDIYFNRGELFLYSPDKNVFAGFGTITPDLDLMVGRLEEQEVQLPFSALFRSDPYRHLAPAIRRATIVGRDTIAGKSYNHLVFVEPGREWQLWIDPAARSLPRRAQITNTTLDRQPRIIYDYTDWNLSPNLSADYYVFTRPQGAIAVSVIPPELK